MARILLVEDDMFFAPVLEKHLTTHAHFVSIASNVEGAVALMAQGNFDLVIADVFIDPEEAYSPRSCFALIEHVDRVARVTGTRIPIIAISGGFTSGAMARDVAETLTEFGADAALAKPFEGDQLEALISEVLNDGRRKPMLRVVAQQVVSSPGTGNLLIAYH